MFQLWRKRASYFGTKEKDSKLMAARGLEELRMVICGTNILEVTKRSWESGFRLQDFFLG